MEMLKRFILVAAVAFFVQSTVPAFAGKPVQEKPSSPLRALWQLELGDQNPCDNFAFLETGVRVVIDTNYVQVYGLDNYKPRLTGQFATREEAEDYVILLFIAVNGLDATLDDVPIDGSGQRDCQAWNAQLLGY
jgi:hypothetical protein